MLANSYLQGYDPGITSGLPHFQSLSFHCKLNKIFDDEERMEKGRISQGALIIC